MRKRFFYLLLPVVMIWCIAGGCQTGGDFRLA